MAISHAQPMLLLLLSLFFLPTLRAIPFTNCGTGDGSDSPPPVEATGVELFGDNEDKSFKITASTVKMITGGIMRVELQFGVYKLYDEKFDVCEIIACPVVPGAFEILFTKPFYKDTEIEPTVTVTIYDAECDYDRFVTPVSFQPRQHVICIDLTHKTHLKSHGISYS
ncbi:unnamed protein product, partial [Thlaspi arvense]